MQGEMKGSWMKIGLLEYDVNMAEEYLQMASDDESAAIALSEKGLHRQALYFIIQSMEKHIQAKVWTKVDIHNADIRDSLRHHSLETTAQSLVRLYPADGTMRSTIQKMLDEHVFGGIKFEFLHNDLRYPYYSKAKHTCVLLLVNEKDYQKLFERLQWLKRFLADIEMLGSR